MNLNLENPGEAGDVLRWKSGLDAKGGEWIVCDSILQELTVAAIELFRADHSFDDFLERTAMRLGLFAIAALDIPDGSGRAVLFASAGLSRKSRSLPIDADQVRAGNFPWPEVDRSDGVFWSIDITPFMRGKVTGQHAIVLFRSKNVQISPLYRNLVARIARIFCRAREHKNIIETLQKRSRELREQRELFESICENLTDGIVFISGEKQLEVVCNRRLGEIFGLSALPTSREEVLEEISGAIVQASRDTLQGESAGKDGDVIQEMLASSLAAEEMAWAGASSTASGGFSLRVGQLPSDEGIILKLRRRGDDGEMIRVRFFCRPVFGQKGERSGVCWYFRELVDDGRARREFERALEKERESRKLAERASRQAEFLAELGRVLVSSLRRDELLRRIIELLIPTFSDAVAIDLLSGNGFGSDAVFGRLSLEPSSEISDLSEERTRIVWDDAFSLSPLDSSALLGPGHVLATGRPELFPVLTEADIARFSSDQNFIRRVLAIRPVSAIYVPLIVRGNMLGVLGLCRLRSGTKSRYGSADLKFAEDMAGRIALAIDSSQLHLRAENAVKVRDEFLSVASHELRTPVTSFRLAAQGLQLLMAKNASRLGNMAATIQEPVKIILRQSDRLERFVSRLLDASALSIQRGGASLETFALDEMARDLVVEMADEFQTAGSIPEVDFSRTVGTWDKASMERILMNLVTNALKFGGGRPVEISVWQEECWAILCVRDHGIGIAEGDRQRIFGKFERAVSPENYSGFGIGLSVVSELVGAMGGFLSLRSALGEGAAFMAAFPVTPPAGGWCRGRVAIPLSWDDRGLLNSSGALSEDGLPPPVRSAFSRGSRQR